MELRQIDDVGRLVIPIEIRRQLEIKHEDEMSINFDAENASIILQKIEPQCVFCNAVDELINFNKHNVCKDCIKNLKGQITTAV